jgi:hypothetical protein
MSTTEISDRFAALPDDQELAATVVALEEHGFSVEVVDGLGAAREAVLARIPHGSSVMTNTSMTLQETGIADAINDGGLYDSGDPPGTTRPHPRGPHPSVSRLLTSQCQH